MRFLCLVLFLLCAPLYAQSVTDIAPRDGWATHPTNQDFATLVSNLRAAVSDHGMAVVTRAGPTGAAANRGVTIPGNQVIGVFNNTYAVRILRHSTHAMIHAPIRFYVTENTDGTATLSYILPSALLSPYFDDADPDLQAAAEELDAIFDAIAQDAAAR